MNIENILQVIWTMFLWLQKHGSYNQKYVFFIHNYISSLIFRSYNYSVAMLPNKPTTLLMYYKK